MGQQINVTFPPGWKEELKKLALKYSRKEKIRISYSDLIRTAVQGAFNLKAFPDIGSRIFLKENIKNVNKKQTFISPPQE
jgi:hypothetical protein